MGSSKGGRDMERDVATWLSSSRLELMSRHHVDVATSCWCRDMGDSAGGCDIMLTSRHGRQWLGWA